MVLFQYTSVTGLRDGSSATNSYLELGVDIRTNRNDFTILANGEPLVSDQVYPLGGDDTITTMLAVLKGPGNQLQYPPISLFLRSHCGTDSHNPVEVSADLWNWKDESGEPYIKYTPPCPQVQFAGNLKSERNLVLGNQALDSQGSKLPVSIFNAGFVDRKLFDRSIHNPAAASNDMYLNDVVLLYRCTGDKNASNWKEGTLLDGLGNSTISGRPIDFSMEPFEDDFGIVSLFWDLSAVEDTSYSVKIQSRCQSLRSEEVLDTDSIQIVIDRSPPKIYGTPTLHVWGDANVVHFTEDISCIHPFVFDLHVAVKAESTVTILQKSSGLQVKCQGQAIKFILDKDYLKNANINITSQFVVHLANVEDLAGNTMTSAFEATMTNCAQDFFERYTKFQGCNGVDDNCDGVIDDCTEDLSPPDITMKESVLTSSYKDTENIIHENILFVEEPAFGSFDNAKNFLIDNIKAEDDCAGGLDIEISGPHGSCENAMLIVNASDPRCAESNSIQTALKGIVFRVDNTPPSVFAGFDHEPDPEFYDDDGAFLHVRESIQNFENIGFWYNVTVSKL